MLLLDITFMTIWQNVLQETKATESLSWSSSSSSLRGSTSRNPIMERAPSKDATPTSKEKISCRWFEAIKNILPAIF